MFYLLAIMSFSSPQDHRAYVKRFFRRQRPLYPSGRGHLLKPGQETLSRVDSPQQEHCSLLLLTQGLGQRHPRPGIKKYS